MRIQHLREQEEHAVSYKQCGTDVDACSIPGSFGFIHQLQTAEPRGSTRHVTAAGMHALAARASLATFVRLESCCAIKNKQKDLERPGKTQKLYLMEGPECFRYKCFVEVIVQPYMLCA
jgi:hypothetical protein